VEHPTIKKFITENLTRDENQSRVTEELSEFAELVNDYNKKFNLTGHKTINEIIDNLIINSLTPVLNINVPRGTLMADLGTGSGIPGIPITITNSNIESHLFDSNNKKIQFINMVSEKINNNRFKGIQSRLEEIGHSTDHREEYDITTSRAMSDVYTMCELCAPLLKQEGLAILYTNETRETIKPYMDHIDDLGLSLLNEEEKKSILNLEKNVILVFKKTGKTKEKFPRKINRIKRSLKDIMSYD